MDHFRQNSVFHFLEAVFRGAGNVVVQSNALTIGFVVAVALLLLGAQTYGFVRPVPLHKITKPEDHLKHQQAGQTKPN